jgi:hypothetical protein
LTWAARSPAAFLQESPTVGLLPVISALTPTLMSSVSLGAQPKRAREPIHKTRIVQVGRFMVVSSHSLLK